MPATASHVRHPVPPRPTGAGGRPWRRLLIAAAVLLLGLGAWILASGERRDAPRLLDLAALAALPDAQLEQRLVNDLAQRVAYAGFSAGGWRRFNEPARTLWAVAAIEEEVLDFGFGRLLAAPAEDPAPGLAEARDAYRAMDQPQAADAIAQAMGAGAPPERARAAYAEAVRRPEARARRVAYLRAHLAELADP